MKRYILAAAVIIGAPVIVGLVNNLPTQSCYLDIVDLTALRSARKHDPDAHFRCENGTKLLISNEDNNEPELIDAIDYQVLAQDTNGQCASPGGIGGCRYDSNETISEPQ